MSDAIINPIKGKSAPNLGPVAAMISSQNELNRLCERTGLGDDYVKNLMMSRVYVGYDSEAGFSLAGPVVGAPYATMLLETLIIWGAKKIIYLGWCGAISQEVSTGDIVIPNGAIIEEGTSPHYGTDKADIATPSAYLVEKIRAALESEKRSFHEGLIWTTDAIYRETREKVGYFQKKNVLAVEMELSALFTVGKFRGVDVGGLLVVSDELSALTWKPGFKDERFRQGREVAADVIASLCREL